MPLVFTYGPEALQGRMYDRIGPSNCLGAAILRGHTLVFNKPNIKKKGEGLANVEAKDDSQVFGLLFDLSPKQIEMYDGFYGGYGKQQVQVVPDGAEIPRSATAWIARRTGSRLLPTKAAIDATIAGMEENGAAEVFIEAVQDLEVLSE